MTRGTYYMTRTHATWTEAYAEAKRCAELSGYRHWVRKTRETDRFTRPWYVIKTMRGLWSGWRP